MIQVEAALLPEFLRRSKLFRTIVESRVEYVESSSNCSVSNGTPIRNTTQQSQRRQTARFWEIPAIKAGIVAYILGDSTVDQIEKEISEFQLELPLLNIALSAKHYREEDRLNFALQTGYVELAELLLEVGYVLNERSMVCAASSGRIECVHVVLEHSGHFCIEAITIAARLGHLNVLQGAHECNFQWNTTTSICNEAALHRHMECLQFVVERGCEPDASTLLASIAGGDLQCFGYLLEHGCVYTEASCQAAARYGRVRMLQCLHELGCAWSGETCAAAALHGHLVCLKYAHEAGCPWDRRVCIRAALMGHLPCLQYAHEQGCPWDADAASSAASNSRLSCLRYLHQHGCPWDRKTCARAALAGSLPCLQYAHEQGCAWDSSAIANAAKGGHLACLQYAHERGCPLTHRALLSAAPYRNCFQYILLHGGGGGADGLL